MSINQRAHTYPISVVAAIFFDQFPYWIRYQENKGILVSKEGPIGSRKDTQKRARFYTLDDVRLMADALRKAGVIDQEGWQNCIARLQTMNSPVFKRKKQR